MHRLTLLLLISILTAANAHGQTQLLPNRKLTPGKIAQNDNERQGVTVAMEQKVFARYRLPWTRRAEFKIDHLVPLELGGADAIENLWPQNIRVKPYGAERKELLTGILVAKIAAGKLALSQAQEEVRRDWIDAFIDHVGMVYLK
ncbi:MAG TPA: hypothetical protein VJS88_01470 [Chthoniobacterales bacterium]|nr:hypothetical protein [Chthoniobacterales bacterium]